MCSMRLNYSKEAIDLEFDLFEITTAVVVTSFYQFALFFTCLSASMYYMYNK